MREEMRGETREETREKDLPDIAMLLSSTTKEFEAEKRINLSAPLSQRWRVENEEFVYSPNSSWDTAVTLRVRRRLHPTPACPQGYPLSRYRQVSLSNLALHSP
jgi:hypothetical protein